MSAQRAPAWAGAATGLESAERSCLLARTVVFLGNVQHLPAQEAPQPSSRLAETSARGCDHQCLSLSDARETFSRAELSKARPVLLKKRMHTFTDTKIWDLGLLNELVPRF